jgi:hypothetical protein
MGMLPFPGPEIEDFREQHLHDDVPSLEGQSPLLAACVTECLYKAPAARPTPANILARLSTLQVSNSATPGIARLQGANLAEVARQAEESRARSESMTQEERRRELAESASQAMSTIGDSLKESILAAAPASRATESRGGWSLTLNQATLVLSPPERTEPNPWGGWGAPAFDVLSHLGLSLRIPEDRYQYEGRSHSLWLCDAQVEGAYAWFETAFMFGVFSGTRSKQSPFALAPGQEAAKAIWAGMTEFQVAWPFTRLTVGDLGEFLDRWAGWFADAATSQLTQPSTMPERDPHGSWRRG